MISANVYLAGPIAGLTIAQALNWRTIASRILTQHGIACFSPLRGKALALADEPVIGKVGLGASPLTTDKAIMARDRFDVLRADVVLAYLLGATTPSMGTVMEIAWAHLRHIPVVAVVEPGSIYEHAMLNEAISFRAEDLEGACEIVRSILHPGVA